MGQQQHLTGTQWRKGESLPGLEECGPLAATYLEGQVASPQEVHLQPGPQYCALQILQGEAEPCGLATVLPHRREGRQRKAVQLRPRPLDGEAIQMRSITPTQQAGAWQACQKTDLGQTGRQGLWEIPATMPFFRISQGLTQALQGPGPCLQDLPKRCGGMGIG